MTAMVSTAFTMSYTVRQATETAVKTSISTPVRPANLAVATICIPGSKLSG